jgi:DNA-binding response OmpR family regulator
MIAPVHILAVDDDPDVLASTVRLLRNAGYATSQASSGLAGLDAARRGQPDLLLLDVDLPDISGLEVCRRLKAEPTDARPFVVLLSASRISTEDQSLGLELGADGYIARPIANRELLARVQAYVRLQQAESALRQSESRLKSALAEKEQLVAELQTALREVKTLSGLIPICAGCKSIRDDRGYWSRVEHYIAERADVRFSHGLCPQCISKYFPDFADEPGSAGSGGTRP